MIGWLQNKKGLLPKDKSNQHGKLVKDSISVMIPYLANLEQIRARVQHTLETGVQIDLSTEECKKYLRRHVNSKIKIAVLYIDIIGSTNMNQVLPASKLALMLQVFSQEMTMVSNAYGGYVLKYVGDAVITLFPADYDPHQTCENAINCAKSMLAILKECINPPLKAMSLPEINVNISVDVGEVLVVLYGKSIKSHIDIIGLCISIAAKMLSQAPGKNQIIIGQSAYSLVRKYKAPEENFAFKALAADISQWPYKDLETGEAYSLYTV